MPSPQLLLFHNLDFNARTIRDHVEHLRTHDFVWWGRFYGGPKKFTAAQARKQWPHVAQFFERRGEDLGPILHARDAVQRAVRQ